MDEIRSRRIDGSILDRDNFAIQFNSLRRAVGTLVRGLNSTVAFVGLLVASTLVAETAENVTVIEISGVKVSGSLKSWSLDQLTLETPSSKEVVHTDIRFIVFERPQKKSTAGDSTICLSNGDRISAQAVTITDDQLTVSWKFAASLRPIPLEKVAAIIFDLPATKSEQNRLFADIETFPPGSDLVMLSNGDRSTGEVQKLDASFLELKSSTRSLQLDRSKVRAVRFNPELTNAVRIKGRRANLILSDGSRLTATHIEMSGTSLKIKSQGLGEVVLPLEAISVCNLFGAQVIPLTDYDVAKIDFTPFLSTSWPLVRNANVLYGPLTLRGSEFTTGLGMHSRSIVAYDLRGNEKSFQSLVGIDDAANGKGSVIFAVDVDGKRAWTSEDLTGQSPAMNVPEIDLRGAKRLTLLVDYGQYADVSDYADWCDAVLILDSAR